MNTVLVLLCVVAQFSVAFTVKDTQTCLTWNVTDEHLFLKCKVFGLKHKMKMIDASKHIRAECTNILSLNCATNRDDDFAFTNSSENGFSLVLKTTKTNGEGKWTCLHGTNEANVNIRISEGTVYSADVQLSGEVMEMKDHFRFILTCFSCWVPYMTSVYFIVNDVLEDNIRYSDGKCYHKRKECSPTECTCSTEGNNFTWVFISDLSYLEFSCEMKFNDEYHLSIQTASVIYMETEFKQDIKRINTIEVSDKAGGVKKEKTVNKTVWIACFSSVMIIFFSVVFLKISRKIKKIISHRFCQMDDNTDKIEQFCGNVNCHKGVQIVADVICIECTLAFCRTCIKSHKVDKPAHQICPIQRVTCLTSHTEIICNSCCIKRIDRFCKECLTPICESCTNDHKHEGSRNANMSIIYPITLGQKRQKTKQIIKHQYNVSIKKEKNDRLSICGLSFVENDKLVVVDSVNRMIIVFGLGKEQFRKKIEDEPRAMTAMTGNKIAITFAYTKLIRIFQVSEGTVDIIDSEQIYLPDVGLPHSKPFSIAFDSGLFAVEVGEGDDGKIIILDKKKIHKSITNDKNFALFTGNTIRLAVEVKTKEPLRGRIYVSAVDRRMVICVDFEGNKLWYTSVQGPRGIIIVQQESMKTNLIVACRRSNTIFSISEDGGNEEVLLERNEIKSPRYMSYHKIKEQLCIQVAKNKNEDELSVFSFNHPFQRERQL